MKNFIALVMFFAFSPAAIGHCSQVNAKWHDLNRGIDEMDLRTVAVDQQNQDMIYAGSVKTIFKSCDGGKTWQKMYLVRGSQTWVNTILIDPTDPVIVYAATQDGLFKSTDRGTTWNKAFKGIGDREKEIRHMAIDQKNSMVYLGTGSGLFISKDNGRIWNKSSDGISEQIINFIAIDRSDPGTVYIATSAGVYKSKDKGATWEKIFTVSAQTEETGAEEISDDTDLNEEKTCSNKVPNCVLIDNENADRLYIGTDSGVFISDDAGKIWEELTSYGLINRKINYLLLLSDGALCAATAGGVFTLPKPYIHWDEVYNGLSSKEVRCLAYDKKNNSVLAATKKGIFLTQIDPGSDSGPKDPSAIQDADIKKVLSNFNSEPSIQEIQETAIKYAEVHKEKIDEWRKGAKRKAMLPTLSINANRGLTDYYHWDSGTNPDTLQKGKDPTDWSVTASWNLGDLIWNNDQNNIDVRSRLMVQLRDDILNEVTHLYFERRRLQINLATNPSNNIRINLERELRLQELTAEIDALTGGYLSKRIRRVDL